MTATTAFVFSLFMALGQFVDPYSSEEVQKFIAEKENLESWEKEAYEFQPLSAQEIFNLSVQDKVAMAKYLRASCVRIMSSSQTPRSIARGNLIDIDFEFLMETALSAGVTEKLQARLLPEEQNISLPEAMDFVRMACDTSVEIKARPTLVESPVMIGPPGSEYYDEDHPSHFPQPQGLQDLDFVSGARHYLEVIQSLPQISSEEDLPKLPEVSFIKDKEGKTLGEYSLTEVNEDKMVVRKNRRRLSTEPIPDLLKKSLVSIEDERFWNFEPEGSENYEGHKGVDFKGLMRAAHSTSSGGGVQGASTLTMQLAKNLLLYKEVFNEHHQGKRSLVRKLKEYILVRQLERVLTKDQILEWYLNTIDFGRGAQGVVMAAQDYFGKSLSELTLEDMAFLAGLPKSPNTLDPQYNYEEALQRRNIVLNKLRSNKFITREERDAAKEKAIEFIPNRTRDFNQGYAQFYISAVEHQMRGWLESLGQPKRLGFDVTVPINYEYQQWAVESLQRGLLNYERSRGRFVVNADEDQLPNIREQVEELAAEKNLSAREVFSEVLKEVSHPYVDGKQFSLGVVVSSTELGLLDGSVVNRQPSDRSGNLFKLKDGKRSDLNNWDVVLLQPFPKRNGGTYYKIASFTRTQGAVVVVENATGKVIATSGGFSIGAGLRYKGHLANRAFTAFRQPGSTVKPFTYLFAMQRGLSTSEIIPNRDLVMPQIFDGRNRRCNTWRLSESYGNDYYSLRRGLEKSKNKVTVNTFLKALGLSSSSDLGSHSDFLSQGLDGLLNLMKNYGLYYDLEKTCFPIMLGAEEIHPVDIAGAYSSFARKGLYIKPHLVNSVTRRKVTVEPFYSSDDVVNGAVLLAARENSEAGRRELYDLFRLRTMMQGVVNNGTAQSISRWSDVIAGKTGTTNSYKDAWFVGYNKDITVAVWVGRPDNKTLGSKAEGASVALPVFEDFMEHYYAKYPEKLEDKFSESMPGLVEAYIEPNTGFLISETFKRDFKEYTGLNRNPYGRKEYFFSVDERNQSVKHYYHGSRDAGNLFFDSLSESYRAHYRGVYDQQYANDTYVRAYQENQAYCDEWTRKGYGTHPDVVRACDYARQYRDYAQSRQKSFRQFYLEYIGFTN